MLFETSEHSWHGFTQIQLPEDKQHLSRKSIALYFYTLERPEEEIAPRHATFYAQRPLPEKIKEGYTLTEGDAQKLRQLVTRRDKHIKLLHNRELQFSKQIAQLQEQPLSSPVKGCIDLLSAPIGYWRDKWVAKKLSCSFRTLKATKSLILIGYVPENFSETVREITVVLNGKESKKTVKKGAFTLKIPCRFCSNVEVTLCVHTSHTEKPQLSGENQDQRNLAFHLQYILVE